MSKVTSEASPSGTPPAQAISPGRTRFETELQVRPDDIDMNAHVHASKYFDYVLAARYDQMARCYKMSMEEFIKAGYGWFARNTFIEFKRPLGMGDAFIVRTWIEAFQKDTVRVDFQIIRKATGKMAADGYAHFTLVSLKTGRAESIPEWIVQKYAV